MSFTRKRKTDDKNDIELECQFFLYSYGKPRQGGIKKPQFEEVSRMQICLCPIHNIDPKPTPMFMCPSNCSISLRNCEDDPECRDSYTAYHQACYDVIKWNGTGDKPQCYGNCKNAMKGLASTPMGLLYTCCECEDDMCRQGKRNLKTACTTSSTEHDVCDMMRSTCDDDDMSDGVDDTEGTKVLVHYS